MRQLSRRIVASALVSILLIAGGATVALADGDASGSETTDVDHKIGNQEITIRDATITISNTSVEGSGLPNATIDDRQYTVGDSTTTIEGLTLSVNGETYEICRIELTVENVGLELQNVELSG